MASVSPLRWVGIRGIDVRRALSQALLLLGQTCLRLDSRRASVRCEGLTEDLVLDVARAMVSSGLRDAGYIYVNIDDCWMEKRGADGHSTPPARPMHHYSSREYMCGDVR